MIIKLILVSLLTIKIIKCAEAELKEALNENLIKFHSKSPPLSILQIPLLQSGSTKLPLCIYTEICGYFNFDDLIVVSETCKDFLNATRLRIASTVSLISSYYVFKQHWINMMIYKMINNDKLDEDQLHLITFKFIKDQQQLNFSCLNILQFLYETVYEIKTLVPLNQKDWRISFLRHIQTFEMPKTTAFIINYYENYPEELDYNFSDWIDLIDLFSRNPSIMHQTHFRNLFNHNSSNHYSASFTIPDEFEIIYQENLKKSPT